MSSCNFSVIQHIIPCQYVRGYPHAVKSNHGPLRLAIKEYRPLNNLAPLQDSVTIIAAHANGFPKETYEPLFDDLLRASKGRIRSIWVADSSHQGASGVLNEYIQGDDREHLELDTLSLSLKNYRHILIRRLNYSRLVRPLPWSLVHGQSLPIAHATAHYWRRS